MKRPDSFLTNTTTPAGRGLGAAKNNPGDNTGTGADKEIYNDPVYAVLAMVESYKETGNSNADETLDDSDMRDAIEEMASKKVTGVNEWNAGTTYTVNQLVMYKGFQFYSYNTTGNLAKPPLQHPEYWLKTPTPEVLLDQYFSGCPIDGGLNPIADRAGVNYKQNALIGKYRLGGNGDTFYNFYRIALDGTQVTGDANLEAIFDVGGANEYFNLDLVAPVDGGTRTLIDMSSRHIAPQSVSGENDTLGEFLEDRFQGHKHSELVGPDAQNGDTSAVGTGYRAGQAPGGLAINRVTATQTNTVSIGVPIPDGVSGPQRTGLTTRPKEFTVGASYIIVMIPV